MLCSLIPFQKASKPNEIKANHFLNQYRRKNTNQGQNKHLKQKTIKKNKKKLHDKQKYKQNLSKRSSLLEKKNITNLQRKSCLQKDGHQACGAIRLKVWGERRPVKKSLKGKSYEWSVIPPYHVYIYNLYITGYISGHMLGGRPLSLVHKTFRMLWWLLIWCFRNYFLHIPDITTAFQIGKIPASTKSSQTDLTTLKFSSVGWWELPMKNSASVLGGKKSIYKTIFS